MNPDGVLCLVLLLLTPCAIVGVALMTAGLCRSRNAAHALVSSVCAAAVAILAWFAIGHALARGAGHAFSTAHRSWNWIGSERPFLLGADWNGSPESLRTLLGMMAAALAATIPLSSGGERWRLGASCASAAILAGVTFPLFAHWSWGGGWLAGFGFVDNGGAGAIHGVGGITALSVAWILGPRSGKYTQEGAPFAFPGHNAVLALTGCFFEWIGWLGFNGAGTILWSGMDAGRVVAAIVNTTLCAAAAGALAAATTRLRFGKTDASLTGNGWTAGLVAASAGCAGMRPAAAVLTGAVAGALAIYAIEFLELHLFVDDPGGAIAAHGAGGIWGLLAAGIFGGARWLPQFAGAATLVGAILPLAYGLTWALDRIYRMRVPPEAERRGLDLHELGAGAYPDFPTHNEEHWLR